MLLPMNPAQWMGPAFPAFLAPSGATPFDTDLAELGCQRPTALRALSSRAPSSTTAPRGSSKTRLTTTPRGSSRTRPCRPRPTCRDLGPVRRRFVRHRLPDLRAAARVTHRVPGLYSHMRAPCITKDILNKKRRSIKRPFPPPAPRRAKTPAAPQLRSASATGLPTKEP